MLHAAGKTTASTDLLNVLPPSADLTISMASGCELVANLRHAT